MPVAVFLYLTNFYFIGQTIFTWPKAMAGFFIVLAWDCLRRNRSVAIVALLTALAYHSHPSSIAAAVSAGLWIICRDWRDGRWIRSALVYGGIFALVVAPWLVWTQGILRIPSNMIWQNFAGAGTQEAMSSPLNFVWIRLANAFNTFTPFAFGVYPFDLDRVSSHVIASLPFALGLFVMIPAFRECEKLFATEPLFVLFAFALPATVILLLYSCPGLPVLHGWQPMIGALLFLAVFRLRRTLSVRAFSAVILLQLAGNAFVLYLRAWHVGIV
jgi:hypothetical protein